MPQFPDRCWSAHHFFYHGDLDLALSRCVQPAIFELFERALIDSFFFIRYPLGGPHLRLRCRLVAGAPRAAELVGEVLERATASFLERWPSPTSLDPEKIRQESRAILASVPEPSELYYPPGILVPFAFVPEVERYGGRRLFEASLDFFAISSLQALEVLRDPDWESSGRRGAKALRLLLRQAWGFAASETELLSHLGYRLPLGEEIGDAIWSKADRDFEAREEIYRRLLTHELSLLAAAESEENPALWPVPSLLYEGAKRLSLAARNEAPGVRWQIGHSQLHMTANRLGFLPGQEMHLQRILWRAARDLKAGDPQAWRHGTEASFGRMRPAGASLRGLLEAAIDHSWKAKHTANAG